jgi:hypothetical protein
MLKPQGLITKEQDTVIHEKEPIPNLEILVS